MERDEDVLVRHFRQILIWPLQLMPTDHHGGRHWERMRDAAKAGSPWQPRPGEFDCPATEFQERHYREFITFLPYVQRFLYGEGGSEADSEATYGRSPLHVFRRCDIQAVRVTFKDGVTIDFPIAHIDLYFFYDIDIVILAFEMKGDDLPLKRVQDTMFRFGRSFPAQWDEDEEAASCPRRVAWLDAVGREIAVSDYDERVVYLAHLGQFRSPRLSSHWDFLLAPMVPHHSDVAGPVRYRQIEYHRMPLMAYLSLDDPFALDDDDFYQLGMVTRPGDQDALPHSSRLFLEFLREVCFDRFWAPDKKTAAGSTRMMCNGHAFVMVGMHGRKHFSDASTGALGQFRHQLFLLTLVAHFHKAALLLFSDRVAALLSQLNIRDPLSVRMFKRDIRLQLEVFLRFRQRYWFREVSNQMVAAHLYSMLRNHLGTEALFDEVQASVQNMNQYLENDDLRRQADTVVRLTVVTILGMVGTTASGFLGMNIFDFTHEAPWTKFGILMATLIPTMLLTFYTLMRSRGLSEFLDAMADERMSWRKRILAFFKIWKKRPSGHTQQ
ncbi:hypothetical protein SAMN02745857_02179 [Andreprevotia lacus DSM 23236]|jgi:hypothetical protein|uniref:CorA-like Mg2+ transporter protein n=1 Tax=Andreprevotia lacus DSM 23236 TaxID=1121001 RepID=A0A1W1XPL2_9NEIS|nr:hypothetical protein [Andreprevotia lacus]SMC25461.1 hypothetical protein SAMN02745857_02179 [Andreprevotia lacus DSM 23236]